jgi:hypothetical protein
LHDAHLINYFFEGFLINYDFLTEDIDNSVVRYILTAQGPFYEDSFTFDIYDSRPNRIPGNSFHLTWSTVEFERALVNVTETAGIVHIPVKRRGNLKHVSCFFMYSFVPPVVVDFDR